MYAASTLRHARGQAGLLILAGLLAAPGLRGELVLRVSLLDAPVARESTRESAAKASPSGVIRLGDPVPIRLELINEGPSPVELLPSVDPAAGFVTLYLSGPDTNAAKRLTTVRWETKDYFFKRRNLAPGAKLVCETFLFGRLTEGAKLEYLFPRPGKYEIRAEHNAGVFSNPLRLEVGSPVAQWDELKKAGIVELVEGRVRSREEVARKSAEVLKLLEREPTHSSRVWLQEKARTESK